MRGRGNLYSHLSSLFKSAEKKISIVTTDLGLQRKAESLKNALNRAKERGVKVTIVSKKAKNTSKIQALGKVAQIKYVDDVPARFVVIDG